MSQLEIEAVLNVAFRQCEVFSCPLSDQQKQILLQTIYSQITSTGNDGTAFGAGDENAQTTTSGNPLDQLSPEERQILLEFVEQADSQNQSWKTTLLNDWIESRDSGSVQFIRDRYGLQWLEQVKPHHLASYISAVKGDLLKLKVGDRIEVTNGLWEWVQDDGPCRREWFPCTVLSIRESSDNAVIDTECFDNEIENIHTRGTSCIVRFDAGAEYEIQGVYDWNRPNWRWIQD